MIFIHENHWATYEIAIEKVFDKYNDFVEEFCELKYLQVVNGS